MRALARKRFKALDLRERKRMRREVTLLADVEHERIFSRRKRTSVSKGGNE